jgi:hypothetical protein
MSCPNNAGLNQRLALVSVVAGLRSTLSAVGVCRYRVI